MPTLLEDSEHAECGYVFGSASQYEAVRNMPTLRNKHPYGDDSKVGDDTEQVFLTETSATI